MNRTVDDLPFDPTTWIDGEPPLRHAERGHQLVHAVEAEPHAEQLEAEQVAPRPRAGSRAAAVRARRGSSASLSRSASTTWRGRPLDERSLASLPSSALDLALELLAPGRDASAGLAGVEGLARADCARRRRAPRPRRPASSAVGGQLEPRQPRHAGRELVVARRPRAAPASRADGLTPDLVAVAAQRGDRLDHAAHDRLGLLVDSVRRRPRATSDTASSAALAGHVATRSPRSRTASTGCSSASMRSRTYSSVAETAGGRLLVVQPRLGQLEVPVAHLGPEDVVQLERRARDARTLDQRRRAAR